MLIPCGYNISHQSVRSNYLGYIDFHGISKPSRLYFQTRTTIDTLDYSGSGFNEGSKVVVAAAGPAIRELLTEVPSDLRLPEGYRDPQVCLPAALAVQGLNSIVNDGVTQRSSSFVISWRNRSDQSISTGGVSR